MYKISRTSAAAQRSLSQAYEDTKKSLGDAYTQFNAPSDPYSTAAAVTGYGGLLAGLGGAAIAARSGNPLLALGIGGAGAVSGGLAYLKNRGKDSTIPGSIYNAADSLGDSISSAGRSTRDWLGQESLGGASRGANLLSGLGLSAAALARLKYPQIGNFVPAVAGLGLAAIPQFYSNKKLLPGLESAARSGYDKAIEARDAARDYLGEQVSSANPQAEMAPFNFARYVSENPGTSALGAAGLAGLTYAALGGHDGVSRKIEAMRENPGATAAGVGSLGVLSALTYEALKDREKKAEYKYALRRGVGDLWSVDTLDSNKAFVTNWLGETTSYDLNKDKERMLERMNSDKRRNALIGGAAAGLLGAALGARDDSPGLGALVGSGLGAAVGYGGTWLNQIAARDALEKRSQDASGGQSNLLPGFLPSWEDVKKKLNILGPITEKIKEEDAKETNVMAQVDRGIDTLGAIVPYALGGLALGGLGYGGYKLYDHLREKKSSWNQLNVKAIADRAVDEERRALFPERGSLSNFLGAQRELAYSMGLPVGQPTLLEDKAREKATGLTLAMEKATQQLLPEARVSNDVIAKAREMAAGAVRPAMGSLYNNRNLGRAALLAGTGLGTYLGDQDWRSAGLSALGSIGGAQLAGNIGLALAAGANAYTGTPGNLANQAAVTKALMLAGALGGGAATGRLTKKKKKS